MHKISGDEAQMLPDTAQSSGHSVLLPGKALQEATLAAWSARGLSNGCCKTNPELFSPSFVKSENPLWISLVSKNRY